MPPSANPELTVLRETCRALTQLRDEAAARSLAELVVRRYTTLTRQGDDDAKAALFAFLVEEFAPDPAGVTAAVEAWREAPGPQSVHGLWAATEAPRLELFRSINLAADGIHTLLTMRADLLRLRDERLAPAEGDLAYLLSSWFNRGFLELRAIDWNTPAETLEKLIEYEAVHEIRGWDDLRRRLETDRRCYGFFHPSLPAEPLIFVEIALVHGLATRIGDVIDAPVPDDDLTDPDGVEPADTAIFYSITNCQAGLRGIPLGDFLLKQVTEELQATVPSLTRFSTLSPVPGLRRWVDEDHIEVDPSEAGLRRLTARYLLHAKRKGEPRDPVARFHLRNGARLEQINVGGDRSLKGEAESFGVLVNYLYDLDTLAENHEAYVNERRVTHSARVADLLTE
ncbi:MAG: malonyl-CoA decarboxylase family protein [Actinomycetota bacterium]